MAYSDFKNLHEIERRFNIVVHFEPGIFVDIASVPVSENLQDMLAVGNLLAISSNTEKARSEFLIAPILLHLLKHVRHMSLFSGIEFNVDESKGLNGFCDFILSRSSRQVIVTAPIMIIVEAKNSDIRSGLGQCFAEMFAARIFNEQGEVGGQTIYGAVTSGDRWSFLSLDGVKASIDPSEYSIQDHLEKIFGILTFMVS